MAGTRRRPPAGPPAGSATAANNAAVATTRGYRRSAASNDVGQQHRPRHRPHTARDRGQEAGDLGHGRIHVAGQPGRAGDRVADPADADIDHRGAGLDPVGLDEVRHADGGDHDVRPAHFRGEVERCASGSAHGRIHALAGEQKPERTADGDTPADDDDVLAGDRHVVRMSSSTMPAGVHGNGE